MRDIGFVLNKIMQTENCSPVCALFMLTEEDNNRELYSIQPESSEEISRRLCDSGNIKMPK